VYVVLAITSPLRSSLFTPLAELLTLLWG